MGNNSRPRYGRIVFVVSAQPIETWRSLKGAVSSAYWANIAELGLEFGLEGSDTTGQGVVRISGCK